MPRVLLRRSRIFTLVTAGAILAAAPARAAPISEPFPAEPAPEAPDAVDAPGETDDAPQPETDDPRAPSGPQEVPATPAAPETVDASEAREDAPPAPQIAVTPTPAPSPVDRAITKQRRAGLGMMIAGWSLFGIAYLTTAFRGVVAIDQADGVFDEDMDDPFTTTPSKKYGQRLLIPIAGPFIAAPEAPTATQGFGTALAGTLQLTGVALGIAGTVLYVKAKRRGRDLAFGAAPTPGGAAVQMRLRF
jgi:hypothetical protein